MKQGKDPYLNMVVRYLGCIVATILIALVSACIETNDKASLDGDLDLADGDSDADTHSVCQDTVCPEHAACDAATGQCICLSGFESLGERCVAVQVDGDWGEDDHEVKESESDSADSDQTDVSEDGDAESDTDETILDGDDEQEDSDREADEQPEFVRCATPQAPTLSVINEQASLQFVSSGEGIIQVGVAFGKQAASPQTWQEADSLTLDQPGNTVVFARLLGGDCEPVPFVFTYDVRETYPPAAGQVGSTAVALTDSRILGWATRVEAITFGEAVDEGWMDSAQALGPAEGTAFSAVSLGRGGSIVLGFADGIRDGEGDDFAVYENAFSDDFLELAFVEVSTDGETFIRFDSAYLGQTPLEAYGTHDTRLIGSLAGKYRQGFGTPFDLAVFANRPEVQEGLVDLSNIRYVKVIDIVGDGSAVDSFGRIIYDPYPTIESAGFDLDGVCVLNN